MRQVINHAGSLTEGRRFDRLVSELDHLCDAALMDTCFGTPEPEQEALRIAKLGRGYRPLSERASPAL